MCLDINPKHPHMLVVGLADGNVAVYNLQIGGKKPAYLSSATNGKHRDTVWQVTSKNLLFTSNVHKNFFSIVISYVIIFNSIHLGQMGSGQFGWIFEFLLCFW